MIRRFLGILLAASMQNILAHEADHLTNNFVHPTGSPGWQTPNTLTCGG
jgi:hypothetical protein